MQSHPLSRAEHVLANTARQLRRNTRRYSFKMNLGNMALCQHNMVRDYYHHSEIYYRGHWQVNINP